MKIDIIIQYIYYLLTYQHIKFILNDNEEAFNKILDNLNKIFILKF